MNLIPTEMKAKKSVEVAELRIEYNQGYLYWEGRNRQTRKSCLQKRPGTGIGKIMMARQDVK